MTSSTRHSPLPEVVPWRTRGRCECEGAGCDRAFCPYRQKQLKESRDVYTRAEREASKRRRTYVKVKHIRRLKAKMRVGQGDVCQLAKRGAPGKCYGPIQACHIKPAAQGGKVVEANILMGCESHNQWCSSHTKESAELGLTISKKYGPKVSSPVSGDEKGEQP